MKDGRAKDDQLAGLDIEAALGPEPVAQAEIRAPERRVVRHHPEDVRGLAVPGVAIPDVNEFLGDARPFDKRKTGHALTPVVGAPECKV
jgi:hypothetical protein